MRAGIAVVVGEEMRNYLLEEVLLQVRAGIAVVVGEEMRNYLLEEVLLQVRAGIAVVVGEEMRNYLLEELWVEIGRWSTQRLEAVSNIVGTRMHVWNNSRENDQDRSKNYKWQNYPVDIFCS